MTISEKLAVRGEGDYGPARQAHLLELYKLYVNSAETISARRQSANSFFLTVNTAVAAVPVLTDAFAWITPLAGLVLCLAWARLVRSYRDLNSAKFKVVHELEKNLPAAPFDAEWEALGRGKDPALYVPFTRVEMKVPLIFATLHGLTVAWQVFRVI